MSSYAIGDIQGCYDELKSLLNEVNFQTDKDELWICGDLINRGPKSLECINFLYSIRENCHITLGNHDLHFIAVAKKIRDKSNSDTFQDILKDPLIEKYVDWLLNLSFHHIDKIKINGEVKTFLLTHAGVPPHWTKEDLINNSLELSEILKGPNSEKLLRNMYGDKPNHPSEYNSNQERLRLNINYFTRMRFCKKDGSINLKYKGKANDAPKGFMPWFEHDLKIFENPIHILFGHWAALEGLTGKRNVTALDTGCVWGNKLSALRLEDNRIFSCNKIN